MKQVCRAFVFALCIFGIAACRVTAPPTPTRLPPLPTAQPVFQTAIPPTITPETRQRVVTVLERFAVKKNNALIRRLRTL